MYYSVENNNETTPLISVVIPIYNVSQYLPRCLESVLAQTYTNLEIILVDDGSTDNSGNICEMYAKKDRRIITIHKENGGLSDARNFGLHRANGKYITFIDSDDYVDVNFIFILYEKIEQYHADVSICGYIDATKKELFRHSIRHYYTILFDSRSMLKQWHSKYKHYETMAWNKMYKTDLFIKNEIFYPFKRNHEDVLTTHRLINVSKRIVLTNKPLYYYVYRIGSITKSYTLKNIEDCLYAQNERLKWFKKRDYLESYERLFIKLLKYYMLTYSVIEPSVFNVCGDKLYQHFCIALDEALGFKTLTIGDKLLLRLFSKYHRLIRFIMRRIH